MSISSTSPATNNPYANNGYGVKPGSGAATVKQVNETVDAERLPASDDGIGDGIGDGIKSFAYGFLGFDKPSKIEAEPAVVEEVKAPEEETGDDAYFAGRVAKGIGTLGTIIAILV